MPETTDRPISQLRRTLDTYPNARDEEQILLATGNRHGHGVTTGLTWGDLRAIAERLGAR